jgi:U4/U6.U5 tri-snRNP-associated protein 2
MAEFLADDDEVVKAHKHTTYDLIANICHDGQPGEWVWLWR